MCAIPSLLFLSIITPSLVLVVLALPKNPAPDTCNFAIFGSSDYYNILTIRYDPINAPKFKFNSSLKWDSKIGNIMISYRYVDKFNWMDGIWSGTIGPYNIVAVHYNRHITDKLGFSLSARNIFNDVHRELIGGAKMGRQIVLRMTSSF